MDWTKPIKFQATRDQARSEYDDPSSEDFDTYILVCVRALVRISLLQMRPLTIP